MRHDDLADMDDFGSLKTKAMDATGAAVESQIYESFSRDMRSLSVSGRMVFPTNRVFE